ncbi:MAG: hypothetical protein FJ291_29080 [Planctomycetes bacterium]|nr:hypothetical protein [Planctomycetota bacterium]
MILTERARQQVAEVLRQKPFECDRVFFFTMEGDHIEPADDESQRLRATYSAILDRLIDGAVLEHWPGNVARGATDEHFANFYASYRYGGLLIVVSKRVRVDPGQRQVESPFNEYYLHAVGACIAKLLDGSPQAERAAPAQADSGKGVYVFEELDAWRQCKDLWHEHYPGKWLAVKGTILVAIADSYDALEDVVRQKGIPPPVLFVPPKGEEMVSRVLSGHRSPVGGGGVR